MSDPTMQRRGNGGGGESGGMRTVECLRGRLLAERVASKAAKEEADMLASRLDELEKKLSDEVKMRNKAERRLRRAINKIESLKILDVELSGSSIGSMSSNGCSGHQAPEMEERNDAGSLSNVDSVRSGPHGGEAKGWDGGDGDSAAGSSADSCTQVNSSQDGSWFSVMSEQSGSGFGKVENRMDPDDAKNRGSPAGAGDVDHDSEREQPPAASNGSSKSEASYREDDDDRLALVLADDPHQDAEAGGPRTEHDGRTAELHAAAETNEEKEEESNRLAIVLVDPQPRPDAKADMRGSSNDVQSVLLALRQVKEQLRYAIERRSEGLVAHRELYGH